MEELVLAPIRQFRGQLRLPGSKSMSNRALLLAALAKGPTQLSGLLASADVAHMLAALTQLGVATELSADHTECRVEGRGGPFAPSILSLHLGNAGTAMRPLCAALCLGQGGEFELTGEPRMAERPIAHLVDVLLSLGADIDYLRSQGYPPVRIRPRGLEGGLATVDGTVSSQFLSAVLMAAPLARGPVRVEVAGELVSAPYVDMTLDLMQRFGAEVERQEWQAFDIQPRGYASPGALAVEGDASSASYFLAAGAIGGGPVRVIGFGRRSRQADVRFALLLEEMGAHVAWGPNSVEVRGTGALRALDVDLKDMPDAAMTVATCALFCRGTTSIRGVANWAFKETDRLAAMASELTKLGARVERREDGLSITPPKKLRPARIETYRDHRMAMAFALAALGSAPITILDPGCTGKTFPHFFAEFARLAGVSQAPGQDFVTS